MRSYNIINSANIPVEPPYYDNPYGFDHLPQFPSFAYECFVLVREKCNNFIKN